MGRREQLQIQILGGSLDYHFCLQANSFTVSMGCKHTENGLYEATCVKNKNRFCFLVVVATVAAMYCIAITLIGVTLKKVEVTRESPVDARYSSHEWILRKHLCA